MGWSETLKRGELISGLCQKLLRNDLMDIWFAVVSLHVQRPDLIPFNSLIHPLSGMCDTSIKQFCQISSHISDPHS